MVDYLRRPQYVRWFLVVLILSAAMALPENGHAGELLDDSKSPKKQYSTQFKWVHPSHLGSMDEDEYLLLEGTQSNVEVWLDTTDYMGQRARIYLGLPRQIQGFNSTEHFILRWKTNRIFSSGEVRPGNRAQIYDGSIDADLMIEMFTFTLRIKANYLTGKIRYAPIFEIEPY